jgi:hypothetical protein
LGNAVVEKIEVSKKSSPLTIKVKLKNNPNVIHIELTNEDDMENFKQKIRGKRFKTDWINP